MAKNPNDYVVLRQLRGDTGDIVIILQRHKVTKMNNIKATGRNVGGADEYVQGTPEQIAEYLKVINEPRE